MNILITGGSGFIGSNLCLSLLNHKHNVVCLDNETTGSRITINQLTTNTNFTYISKSIYDDLSYLNFKIDIIFNLACPTSPLFVKNNPELVIKSSNQGVLNLIQLAKLNNSKLIHISTIRVNEDLPGINIYTDSKRISEELIQKYNNFIIIRLASVFGPNMLINDSRVIPQFIQKSLKNENLTIWGNGNQLDTFAYIDNIINVLINAILYVPGIYTFGSKNVISIKDLAYTIISLTNSSSKIKFLNNFISTRTLNYLNDIHDDYIDIIDLKSGLLNTINYFKEHYTL
jgi:UDP-glucuronate decarboxylase